MKKVVVTGIGMLCASGNGKGAAWSAIKAGKPGIGRITQFDASNCTSQVAAEVKDFSGNERVSMTLWGFTPALFDALEARFPAWLAANAEREKSEWYIPFVVDEMVHEGAATVDVLPTESSWFGVTYREDKPFVTAEIRKLVDADEYPASLFPK